MWLRYGQVRQRHRRPSFPSGLSAATTLGYEGLPATLMTLGRGCPGVRNAFWKKRLAAISMSRQQKVDGATARIDSPVKIGPFAVHANVGFIDPPGAIGGLQFPPAALVQLRGVALNPSPDRGVVNWQAALGEQLFDVSVGKGEPQIPTDSTRDYLGFEMAPFE